jgi:hypothetical protein
MTGQDTCLRGHNIEHVGRYKGGQCRECERARVRLWKHNNRDHVLREDAARRAAYRQVFGVAYVPNNRKEPQ